METGCVAGKSPDASHLYTPGGGGGPPTKPQVGEVHLLNKSTSADLASSCLTTSDVCTVDQDLCDGTSVISPEQLGKCNPS